ncbi:MAG: hypothetical protein Q8874_02915, partial [Sweet potato little leaf phytoplasma]|nr:hypothetical protein [Sweet potato little leaf phytoplasma]
PEAILNFLFFLGFSPQTNQNILNKELMINLFNVKRFIKDPAVKQLNIPLLLYKIVLLYKIIIQIKRALYRELYLTEVWQHLALNLQCLEG